MNLTEETENSESAPGQAAVLSTVILLVTYVSVTVAVVAFAGLGQIRQFADDDAIFSTVATGVLGSPWDMIVVLAVLTSALASTQTTILPASRTTLSMARSRAMPAPLGKSTRVSDAARLHHRHRRAGDAVVRGRQHVLVQLPLRHALRALFDDRLLLRPHRVRVRDLLPPRALQERQELRLHRPGARRWRPDPGLPVHTIDLRSGRPERLLHRRLVVRAGPARW